MKSRSFVLFALILVVGLLAVSCDQSFFENQYIKAGIVTAPPAPDAAAITEMKTTAELVAAAYNSQGVIEPAFMSVMKEDVVVKAAVLSTLQADFTSPTVAKEVKQESALLYTQVVLETSGASTIVSQVPAAIDAALQANPTVNSIIAAVIPATPATTPEEIAAAKDSLTAAINAFSSLSGTSLAALGTSLSTDGISVSNTSQIASAAEVAVIGTVINKIDPELVKQPGSDAYYPAGTTVAQVLCDLVYPATPDVTPIFTTGAVALPATDLAGLETADPALYSLVKAASLDAVFTQLAANLK